MTKKTEPRRRRSSKPAAQHSHVCRACGWPWDCLQGTKCQVDTAARVNGQGPWCLLCYHLISAAHAARVRRLAVVEQRIARVFAAYQATPPV